VIDEAGQPVPPGVRGEIAVYRRGTWLRSRDLGSTDETGYFWYAGRADDVIITSGWTVSPLEVEAVIDRHPDVDESAVVGVPDAAKGQVLKAFVVSTRQDVGLIGEVQNHVREQLGAYEYPRQVEVVDSLPRTLNGKINRKALREPTDPGSMRASEGGVA
jgi:acetyl-CoA synthetase